MMPGTVQTRRRFLRGIAATGAVGLSLPAAPHLAAAQEMPPTPACGDGHASTPAQTPGPYFTPGSPARTDLREAGMAGTPIVLTGFVLTRSCRPIPRALVELWHADDAGAYDNDGFRLRGHQFSDAAGRYRFATIVPGLYPGRTRHFHVRFQAPAEPVLTTQFYFPGEPGNDRDRIFDAALLLDIDPGPPMVGRYDAVLDVA
jgi:protocatechuate 3,4-dioxygenase beta subunit